MNKRCGTADLDRTLRQLFPKLKWAFFSVEVHEIRDAKTLKQNRGFHWLLREWQKLDPGMEQDLDKLKNNIYCAMWGAFPLTDNFGNDAIAPVKRSTKSWSWAKMDYVRDEATREQMSALIQYVYDIASEDGTVLPEMKKEFV